MKIRAIETRIRRFSYKLRHDFSIENIVLVLAVVLCLAWTYSSIQAMTRNWELSERLATEKKALELLEVEVEAAELENEYYKTEEYQELAARKYLNKKLAGENLVYLPENSEAAKTKHQVSATSVAEKNYSNFEKWLRFLFPET